MWKLKKDIKKIKDRLFKKKKQDRNENRMYIKGRLSDLENFKRIKPLDMKLLSVKHEFDIKIPEISFKIRKI